MYPFNYPFLDFSKKRKKKILRDAKAALIRRRWAFLWVLGESTIILGYDLRSWDTTFCVFSSIGNPFPAEPSLIVRTDTKRLTDRKIEKLFSFFDFLQLPFLPLSRARATHSFEFGNILSGRGNDTSRSFSHSIYR